jgi:hypothetical protein
MVLIDPTLNPPERQFDMLKGVPIKDLIIVINKVWTCPELPLHGYPVQTVVRGACTEAQHGPELGHHSTLANERVPLYCAAFTDRQGQAAVSPAALG